MKRKKLILLFTIVCFFSFNVNFVNAKTSCSTTGTYALRGDYYSDYGTYRKYICLGKNKLKLAYCADKGSKAPKANNAMKVNSAFSSSTVCVAKNKNGTKLSKVNGVSSSNLDCSSMVGFIIRAAKAKYGSSSDGLTKKYYGRTQRTIQSFLYDSGTGTNAWRSNNKRYKYKYIDTLISEAFDAYAKNQNNSIPSDDSSLSISFKLDGNDYKMYYDNNGNYKSYKVTVNVQCNGTCGGTVPASISISTARQGVLICGDNFTNCNDTKDLALVNNSASFYVSTTSVNPTAITAAASYVTKSGTINTVYADSVMYQRKVNPKNVQKLIIYSLDDESETYGGETENYSGTLTLTPRVVEKRTCSDAFSGYTKYSSGTVARTGKKCSSNVTDSSDTTSSVAEYKNCTTSVVDIPFWAKNSSGVCVNTTANVNVSLANYGYFKYGNVLTDKNPVTKGSGFYLQELDNPVNNIYSGTYFINQISWAYNILFDDTRGLYFYIDPISGVHHNSTAYSTESDCKNGVRPQGTVDSYVMNKMKTAINKEFKSGAEYTTYLNDLSNNTFVTVENNDANDAWRVPVIVFSSSNYSSDELFDANDTKTFYYSFKTPYSYFKILDSSVNYTTIENDSKYTTDSYEYGGRRYYTYNKYVGNTFPIDISTDSSLSLIKGMNWSLSADCDINLCTDKECGNLYDCKTDSNGKRTCYINYRYRSISVSEPFPKASEKDDLPDNWKDWWWGNSTNQNRLRNTFNNNLFYKVTLNSNTISEINSNYSGKSYTTWDNIKDTGESSFVKKYNSSSSTVSNVGSYCELGKAPDSSCDKW